MKKPLAVLAILSLPTLTFSQNPGHERAIPESVLALNRGIYMSIEEFLTNDPSLPYYFELHDYLADHFENPEEQNEYMLTYRDDMGYRKMLGAREIWGYCDGENVFVSFQGKRYELVHLGAISVLRYHPNKQRNSIAQILSLYAIGTGMATMEKTQDLLFHLRTDSVIIPTSRNIRKLISEDRELYTNYQSERKMDYFERNFVYLQKYNEKYPLVISEAGIIVSEPMSANDLVEKQPF